MASKPRLRLPSAKEGVLMLVSIVIALVLAEMGVRIVRKGQPITPPTYVGQNTNRPSKNFVADAQTGWRMRRNHEFERSIDGQRKTFRSNGQGFRSNVDFDHPAGVLIGVAGDSFAWGSGVDYSETFGNLVEESLDDVTLHNFAMPGFGLDQMWMSVRHQILPLNPSLVVVAFIDDDFTRSMIAFKDKEGFNKPRFLLDDGMLRPQSSADASMVNMMLASRSQLWAGVTLVYSILSESWPLNTAILDAIASDCQQQGVTILFVRLPERNSKPSRRLVRFFHSRGLPFIDIPGLEYPPADIHIKGDGHLNATGHAFVADAVSNWIKHSAINHLNY
ncbi:MAG TPA: SGNH/GDSL hydrolase family protein [Xanthomonadales bacterium]|nr:SGNH/GDSL hydrolase family protein [Xanthomonadales bacterium]